MLLAKVPVGRFEPTLPPLERLGVTSARGGWGGARVWLFPFLGLGRLGNLDDPVALCAELERARLELGDGGFELGKVHVFCACV